MKQLSRPRSPDGAWRVVESVLPAGWVIKSLEWDPHNAAKEGSPGDRWIAVAEMWHADNPFGIDEPMEMGYGKWPETALLDLAAQLRSRV